VDDALGVLAGQGQGEFFGRWHGDEILVLCRRLLGETF
jgi:hypothetical protein